MLLFLNALQLGASALHGLEELAQVVLQIGEDLVGIVLGAKGHSRRERLLLGSVSSAVAARAHCSVEVVRQR